MIHLNWRRTHLRVPIRLPLGQWEKDSRAVPEHCSEEPKGDHLNGWQGRRDKQAQETAITKSDASSSNGLARRCFVLKGGAVSIDILSAGTSHPGAAASYLHPSQKSGRTHFFISSPKAAQTMNTGLMTPPPYPVLPSCSDRCSTARTRKMYWQTRNVVICTYTTT